MMGAVVGKSKGHHFAKKGKVSVWVSQHPYAEVPDSYFEETFSRNDTRAVNEWSSAFNLAYYNPNYLETNGVQTGLVDIERAVGECSFSTSYMAPLLSKARKKKLEQVAWVILLFEYEYSLKVSGVEKDKYMTFLGAFDYDDAADNLYELEEQ